MTIGIDISQIAFEGSGVGAYVRNMVAALVRTYPEHSFVLFGSSLRKRRVFSEFVKTLERPVKLVVLPLPPTVLEMMWNRLHIVPVEWLTGKLDVFWSSDWTQPPLLSCVGVTTIHDLSILRYPEESSNRASLDAGSARIVANIVATQKRRLARAGKACSVFFCDSEATREDARALLGIPEKKLVVVYPGYGKAAS